MRQNIVEKFKVRSATASEDVGWLLCSRFSGPRLLFELGSVWNGDGWTLVACC